MNNPVSRLEKIDPRNVWENETRDFTPWLSEHLDQLGEVLGMELEIMEREASVGEFSADIMARSNQGRIVIIENQLGTTDHKHLGQLITYAAGFEAAVVVWVSNEVRDEHREAVDWLNSRTDEDTEFFSVVLELVQIDNSLPAANFQIVAFPDTWRQKTKTSIAQTENLSELRIAYREFFQILINRLHKQHQFTSARKSHAGNWYDFAAGVTGIKYRTTFAQGNRFQIALYIDIGDERINRSVFDILMSEKEQIEADFGSKLEWEPLDGKRSSRIAVYRENSSVTETDRDTLLGWVMEKLLEFDRVFRPHLDSVVRKAKKDYNPEI